MNSKPRLQEEFPVEGDSARITRGWSNWFMDVWRALAGWQSTLTATASLTFPAIGAQSQGSLSFAVEDAAPGDAVSVFSIDVAGMIFSAQVTAPNTVTVYAKNFTAGAITPPASLSVRVIVFQN